MHMCNNKSLTQEGGKEGGKDCIGGVGGRGGGLSGEWARSLSISKGGLLVVIADVRFCAGAYLCTQPDLWKRKRRMPAEEEGQLGRAESE